MKKYGLLIFAGFILLAVGFLVVNKFNNYTESKTYTIILTEDGFSPQKLEIKQNDTVTFKTKNKKPFWPASDLHPTHGIYSEFDPKDAVMPNDTWSFKFHKIGEWKFHDHISPYYTGLIIVD